MRRVRQRCVAAGWLFVLCGQAVPSEQLFHRLADLELQSGQRLDCTVGYRTYGTRNDDESNVIVFPTWFGGTTAELATFGKVGPGALADSDRYFVITIDALGNGVSCSPSNSELESSDATPRITTGDMVRAQHRLLREALGIHRVHAVMGISMGGMQALRWLELYPGFMDKVVVIDGSPKLTSYDLLHWTVYRDIVRALQDAGSSDEEIGGVMARVTNLTLYTPDFFVDGIAGDELDEFLQPAYAPRPAFRADDYLSQIGAMMAHDVLTGDFIAEVRQHGVDVLVVSTPSDAMVNQRPAQALADRLDAATLRVISSCGHVGSSCESEKVNARVAAFLETDRARREPGPVPQ